MSKPNKRRTKISILVMVLSFCIIGYAIGLKYVPEYMPFNQTNSQDDFYAPHAGQCVPELEF